MNAIYNFFDAARIHRGKWSHTGVEWNNSICEKSFNHDGYDSKRNSFNVEAQNKLRNYQMEGRKITKAS